MKKRKKPVKKGLYQAKTKAEFVEAELNLSLVWKLTNELAFNTPYKPANSPMSQFDESHARWLMHRDC